jgi:thymidylate synthase
MEISATSINNAVDEGFHWLAAAGVEEDSRNGKVIVSPEPVLTTYTNPLYRVLFSPLRDANPFLHLFEALWMLAGRNDVAWPAQFAKNMTKYSDDGVTLHGAYGHRWRKHFGYDQLEWIVDGLRANPDDRRQVLTMWDPGNTDEDGEPVTGTGDPFIGGHGGKDVPCNTQAYFDLRRGRLNMTVMQRSGDALWGVYGANAVHFSILLEYMAAWLEVPMGVYRQFTNNFHVYPASLDTSRWEAAYKHYSKTDCAKEVIHQLAVDADINDYYRLNPHTHYQTKPFPLVNTNIETWDADLKRFMSDPSQGGAAYGDEFFSTVAAPMYYAWKERKEKRGTGMAWAVQIAAEDWRQACVEWIERREARRETAGHQVG